MCSNDNLFTNKKAIAVLSVSTITILGSTAVSPALAGIKNAFPYMSDSMIQLILTIPPLFIIPSCFGCKLLSDKVGNKNVLIIGIILYLLGGIGAGLMPGFYTMLAARAILGIGCGLITPMAQALISVNFSGSFKEKLTGYSASASYLMGIIASFSVGNLAEIHWRLAFFIYLIAVIVLILNIIYLPADKPLKIEKENAVTKNKHGMNIKALLVIVGMSLINIAFYTFSTSIALFMKNEGIGGSDVSGIVVAVFMTSGFIIGLITSEIRKIAKQFSMAVACVMMGSGYITMFLTSNIILLFIAAALIGGSYSIFYSGVFLAIGNLSRSQYENTKLVTYTTAGMFIGQSVSVYILQLIEKLFDNSGYRFRFEVLGTVLITAAITIIIWGITSKRKKCAKIID